MLLGLACALVVIVLDQLSKYYIMENILNEYGAISFTSFFNLVRAWNTGVSFSMFNDGGQTGVVLLSLMSLTIVCFLIYWLYKEKEKLSSIFSNKSLKNKFCRSKKTIFLKLLLTILKKRIKKEPNYFSFGSNINLLLRLKYSIIEIIDIIVAK